MHLLLLASFFSPSFHPFFFFFTVFLQTFGPFDPSFFLSFFLSVFLYKLWTCLPAQVNTTSELMLGPLPNAARRLSTLGTTATITSSRFCTAPVLALPFSPAASRCSPAQVAASLAECPAGVPRAGRLAERGGQRNGLQPSNHFQPRGARLIRLISH